MANPRRLFWGTIAIVGTVVGYNIAPLGEERTYAILGSFVGFVLYPVVLVVLGMSKLLKR